MFRTPRVRISKRVVWAPGRQPMVNITVRVNDRSLLEDYEILERVNVRRSLEPELEKEAKRAKIE